MCTKCIRAYSKINKSTFDSIGGLLLRDENVVYINNYL
jgi:hypothetical protein